MMRFWRRLCPLLLSWGLFLSTMGGAHASTGYSLGVYYFPGWTAGAEGSVRPQPWEPIKRFPEREPKLGWYSDSDPAVIRQQIQWMQEYGLKFVVFDSYWKNRHPFLDHSLKVFRKVKKPGQLSYALLWANHFRFEGGQAGFDGLVKYWVNEHFSDPDYLRINGKPVLFVFSLDEFVEMAKLLEKSPRDLVQQVDKVAKAAGLPGVALVGATPGVEYWVKGMAPSAGFSILSSYNYLIGYRGSADTATPYPKSYSALRHAYRTNWNWILENSPLTYIVPITSGWDDRPWGGRPDASEQAASSLASFEEHLREAKALMDAHPAQTLKMGVICCWNEFGEGSYIEPTKKEGFGRLERIKAVFGAPRQ